MSGKEEQKSRNYHICQVDPGVRVFDGSKCAVLPLKGSIFLKETLERATARPAIEPDGYFVRCLVVAGRKEPEV